MDANVDELKKHNNSGLTRLILALKTIQRIHSGGRMEAMTDWALALTKASCDIPIALREQDNVTTAPCPHCGKPLGTAVQL